MHQPAKAEMLLVPDKPWEQIIWWYTTILKVSDSDFRIYYDVDGPSGRKLCVALSSDGRNWSKPELDIVAFNDNATGITHNRTNILNIHRSGTTFIDTNPKVPTSQRFKTIIPGGQVFASADGFRWELLSEGHIPYSDTQPVALFDTVLGKYRVYMRNHDRRDSTGQAECVGGDRVGRSVGLLLVDDLAAKVWGPWDHKEDENTTVFKADAKDPPCMDVYTNMYTRVADSHFIFPIMYRHCTSPIGASGHSKQHKNEACAYNHDHCTQPVSASYARCTTAADCGSLFPGHNLTCNGLPIRCNASHFCTSGGPGGELCNMSSVHSDPASTRSPGPECAGPNDGLLEVQMAVSSDGVRFSRISRMAFVARGSGRPRPGTPGVWKGDFDAASTAVAVGTVDSDDETFMYEVGWQYTHGGYVGFTPQPSGPVLSGIRLLRLRRHGFVSLRASGENAVMLSQPMLLPTCGSKSNLILILNIQTSVEGIANVSLVDDTATESSLVLTAVPFIGNNVAARIRWCVKTGNKTTESIPSEWVGRMVQLRVAMSYSDLYSFQFDCVE